MVVVHQPTVEPDNTGPWRPASDDLKNRQMLVREYGSSKSLRPSPTRLIASVVTKIAIPGIVAIHDVATAHG